MRRFPDDALLESVAADGRLDDALIGRLVDQIADFHSHAETFFEPSGHARILSVISGNRTSLERYPDILAAASASNVIDRQIEMAARHSRLLDARAAGGRVRHGHGDLHLANIAVIADEPVLFDCLEFDPQLATSDLLYDLAFLLMDLWERGLRRQANLLFNRYLDLSPADEDGIALFPLFMSVRATIRAHALAARAQAVAAEPEIVSRARRYLVLAEHLLEEGPPRLVAIGGLSGSGKSTIARIIGGDLGRAPGARILRSDVLRKRRVGLAPEQRLPAAGYTKAASSAVYEVLARLANAALESGLSTIGDAVFARREERDALERVAEGRGLRFDGVWLEAPAALLRQRIVSRENDASDADLGVARQQEAYELGDLGR
jgi:predicted kinase